MQFEWDPKKSAENETRRGLSFEASRQFDFDTALVVEDDRYDYGETRWRALGRIDGRLHAMVFVVRGKAIRVISLRKANSREVRRYERA